MTRRTAHGNCGLPVEERQQVAVDMAHALVECRSERYLRVDGKPPGPTWDAIAGIYRTRDQRFVRLHTNFRHHRDAVCKVLNCKPERDEVQAALMQWDGEAFETAAYAAGGLPLEQLRAAEDRAILHVLEKQNQLGLDVVTDGEMRRGSWLTDMADAVEGFVSERVPLEWKGPGGGVEGSTAHAAGAKLRKLRKMTGHEVPFLKKNAHAPFKVTLPAPSNFMLASYKAGITDKFYPTHADLLKDLVEIVRDDVQWLVSEGVQYIQFDAPDYSHYLDPRQQTRMRQAGLDPDEELENAIAGDNAALGAVPRGSATLALHICRGNTMDTGPPDPVLRSGVVSSARPSHRPNQSRS